MSSRNLFVDSVSAIKNAQSAFMSTVCLPFSNLILNFLSVMKDEGYIEDFTVKFVNPSIKKIMVNLKYYKNNGVISDIKVISKPSRKVYWSVVDYQEFYNGLGVFIISTSKGLFPSYKARKMNIGGEVLCAVF